MASRYPSIRVLDYCYRPLHVVDDTKDILVPCGKCNGCLLHKANEWSMRVAQEIDGNPFSIFFTLTYNNKYIPKLEIVSEHSNTHGRYYLLSPDNDLNIRYNGVTDVRRIEDFNDMLFKCYADEFHVLQNYFSDRYTCYSSKRDVQLYLKMLRKSIIEYFKYDSQEQRSGLFRYFIISEYGPTSHRYHIHGLLFPQNKSISEYLLEYSLYANWKMCDEDLFRRYTHYCTSGASQYVTNYITCPDSLSSLYRTNKELKPFRLSSKSPAIGFTEFQNEKIFEDVSSGSIKYERTVKRLGSKSILQYPKNYCDTIFPKCKGYSSLSLRGILSTYGRLWRSVNVCGYRYDDVYRLLSAFWDNQTLNATYRCYKVCEQYGYCPEYYCYLLDEYLYLKDMENLRYQYSQMQVACSDNRIDVVDWISHFFVNVVSFGNKSMSVDHGRSWYMFTESFNISGLLPSAFNISYVPDHSYVSEVDDILQNAVKVSKFNEVSGNSPHIV